MPSQLKAAGSVINYGLRLGKVGLIARDADNQLFAITAARVFADPFAANSDRELLAESLLTKSPVPSARGGKQQPLSILSHLEALGESVFRFMDDGDRAPGRVTALYGSVCVGATNVRVKGIVEVEFMRTDELHPVRRELPRIASNDLGSLVLSYDGAALGLIVGANGYSALVAPIRNFMAQHRLVLAASDFNSSDLYLGIDYQYNELSRARRINFGLMPAVA